MSTAESVEEGARVHWVVAGEFSSTPGGKHFKVTPDSYPQALADAKLSARASVPDRLGAGDKRDFEVAFTKPKSFQLSELITAIPVLQGLRALAEDLGSADATKRPSVDTALSRVTELVGPGKMFDAVTAALRPSAAKTATPSGDTSGVSVDQLEVSKSAQTPKSAVDAFVKAIHPTNPTAPANTSGAKVARAAIEEAVYGTARDILNDKTVAHIEESWRGLKLIVDQCPTAAGMAIEVVDATPDALADAVRAAIPEDAIDHPDAIFVLNTFDELAPLTALGALGEELNSPVIVGISPAVFGAADANAVTTKADDDRAGLPEAWDALRADEVSRWLCALTNRVVLGSDGTGSARRTAFGNPVFALGAMLAASYRVTGSFARIVGQPGGFKAPGTHDLTTGREAGNSAPTEAFMSLRAQGKLAAAGVVGLGSGRNSDVVAISAIPTVKSGTDLVPLPAQILTGRIVRFAQWVRDQLPAGAVDKDVIGLFEQAAGVFLFPGTTDGAGLKAQIVENKTGGRGVLVTASMRAEHASIPFHLAFTLPIAE